MGTYNYRQIRRCDVTGLVLCAAPELHNKNPYAWTKSRMKYFGFVPRQYSTVHTVQTNMRPLVVLIDLMCIAPGGGIPSTSDTYCHRVKSKKKNILSPRLENFSSEHGQWRPPRTAYYCIRYRYRAPLRTKSHECVCWMRSLFFSVPFGGTR